MKKVLFTTLALVCLPIIAYAGYDLSTKKFPDGNNPLMPYSVTIEETPTDVLVTDYFPIYRTTTGMAELIPATLVYGLGAAKAGSFTTIEASGDVTGDGGDQLNGFKQLQVVASTTALTIAQCGSSVVSAGAAVQPLPEASTALGCRYTFVCGTADDFDIDPADGTDQIGSVSTTNGTTGVVTLAPSAGDEIRCTNTGDSITLEAVGANLWAQVGGGNGVWTDVN